MGGAATVGAPPRAVPARHGRCRGRDRHGADRVGRCDRRPIAARDRRRIEELHRAADSRRAGRAGDRARDRRDGPTPAEPRRHADLRSRAAQRRHRRLRRIHRHGADRRLPPAAVDRSAGGVRHRARAATRAPAGRCCRRSASTTRSRSWSAAATRGSAGCARSTMPPARRRGGAPASATSSSSGRMAIPGWPGPTACGSRSRRTSWTSASSTGRWRQARWI